MGKRWTRPNTWLHRQPYQPMAAVAEFHDSFGLKPLYLLGARERNDLIESRARLISEEYDEVMAEIDKYLKWYSLGGSHSEIVEKDEPDLELLAKELADLLYVVYGTAESLEIPLEDVFNEVHRSNMTKLGEDGKPVWVEGYNGKFGKGPNYRPADVHGAITGEWL